MMRPRYIFFFVVEDSESIYSCAVQSNALPQQQQQPHMCSVLVPCFFGLCLLSVLAGGTSSDSTRALLVVSS